MRPAITLILGILLASAAGLRAQAPAAPQTTARVRKALGHKSEKPAAKPASASVPAEAGPVEGKAARRDPFRSLVGDSQEGGSGGKNLPPGKAGLQVSTLRLDGIVKAPNGMIAVVSNPQARTYFLREGDQLYDGKVEKISMDSVEFHEEGKDAFGKPVERQVNKRLYSSAGEAQ